MELQGIDAEKFEAPVLGVNAKGQKTVTLKLKADEDYATNKTYKVQFSFTVDGVTERALSPMLSVKATQTSLKAKAAITKQTVFQSSGSTRAYANTISITAPASATIDSISVGASSSAQLKAALGQLTVVKSADEKSATVSYTLAAPGRLKVGSSYTLVLEVTPEGAATNLKPTQLRVTVKAMA